MNDTTHKISKDDAGYKRGLPQAHCSICKHFDPPEKGPYGSCDLVAGQIAPSAWCKLFARKSANR